MSENRLTVDGDFYMYKHALYNTWGSFSVHDVESVCRNHLDTSYIVRMKSGAEHVLNKESASQLFKIICGTYING